MTIRQWLGYTAEQKAERYLIQQGLILLLRNYRCSYGEIDLIMLDSEYYVFTEVRYRKNNVYGGASSSVDYRKQIKIIRTAKHYLLNHEEKAARFDVITLNAAGKLNWIKNAFIDQQEH